jgi:uncharacterized membrane protein YsdA (DUF1294 family)
MSIIGTIVSHDESLHTGLVMPDGGPHAIPFTEGDVLNWDRQTTLLGQKVRFGVVQTAHGHVAIHIVILQQTTRKKILVSNGAIASLVAPLLVGAATFCLSRFLDWPLAIAYLITVNFIAFVTAVLVATTPRSARARLPEAVTILVAFCGGAPAVLIATYLIPSRLRSEPIVVLLFALVVIQVIAIKRYHPEVYRAETWRAVSRNVP